MWQLRRVANGDRPTSHHSFWAVFGHNCTAHAQKLLLSNFWSKF